jgi:hypothetical protein
LTAEGKRESKATYAILESFEALKTDRPIENVEDAIQYMKDHDMEGTKVVAALRTAEVGIKKIVSVNFVDTQLQAEPETATAGEDE